MGTIYKITNLANNKIYVGQTRRESKERWAEHKKNFVSLQDTMAIHYAMQKYSKDDFVFEEIERCENNILDEREIYWIAYYNSYEEGYNCTPGGQNLPKVDYSKILTLWQEGKKLDEICQALSVERHTAAKALKSFDITEIEIKTRSLGRPVEKYSLQGEFIERYDSISAAAREFNSNVGNIRLCCTRTHPSAYNFLWKYEDDPTPITEWVKHFKKTGKGMQKSVEQYDLNDNYIKTYASCREAARSINAPYHVGINACCLGRQKTAYGYKWKYKEQ